MRQPAQELVAAVVMHDRLLVAPVMMDDGLADDGAELSHALGQPRRHAAAMERQISAARPSSPCRFDSSTFRV